MAGKPEFVTQAEKFFVACETGKGPKETDQYTEEGAKFCGQVVADAFKGIETVSQYTAWMEGLFKFAPDGSYTLHSTTWNTEARQVVFFAQFHGTHTGEGGPCPPTGKATNSDYVYILEMSDANKVRQLTKVWNNAYAFKEFGWMP
mmetsp:Transcript_1947/g.5388  ORF Transcript_1947/g.5388 Transcript_1947/m.5388 type:complete len:146 (+) Transcript_1947:57-494(+)|eukprot:CAMPEP_0119119438 /NCGR_PEP_ID=MMETSP1310-20130426/931_1 /TAXON_ID=464262 /ORGANISM="Genus nov. species nov., Strain RCC2339" /LENGTH=145 /DNA_ID=CAMNT_0007108877 /DNA_START=53 /DNA_END=490 /DNA_ORIENTATION=-